ncbi:SCO3374 family protein [Streptomyces macrosporus]|uniref:SCO3374 family protein n=1 Tax=Streptomyces macrosporus TaxID=44032 RepID=A0ABN3JIG3_9ACTN
MFRIRPRDVDFRRPRNPTSPWSLGGLPGPAAEPVDAPDALEVPEAVGRALLRRRGLRTGAVARMPAAGRTRFLLPPGSAEEVPGLLEWLEWGGIALDLTVLAACDPWEAAVWLRPPGQGCEADLVGLVSAAATECHRARLVRATQPFAFS